MNLECGGDILLFILVSLVYWKPKYQALQFYKLISFKSLFTQPGNWRKTNKPENLKIKRFTKKKEKGSKSKNVPTLLRLKTGI